MTATDSNAQGDMQPTAGNNFSEENLVSSIHRCSSANAKRLCIYDSAKKIKNSASYDIGGTYTIPTSDLWFYYSTSTIPGCNYLLNLFVCHRKAGSFSIGVSNANGLTHTEKRNDISGWSELPRTLTWHHFVSAQPNEIYHLQTFCFSEKNLQELEYNTLLVPISISMDSRALNKDALIPLKLQNDINEVLEKEKKDFVLISQSGKKFPVHRLVILAHSPVLRNLLKDAKNELSIDISDSDMELLLQFLYRGTIKNVHNEDYLNLLKLAGDFQIKNLFSLVQYALIEKIEVEKAVELAQLANKYKLEVLKNNVFSFIKRNPDVLQSNGWKELDDVQLSKELTQFMCGSD